MANFYVQWNKAARRLRLHYGHCAACKDSGRGPCGKTHDCEEFSNYEEAAAAAHTLAGLLHATARVCGLCIPNPVRL